MQIIVNRWYQDVSGVKIAPNLYDISDPALHSMGEWLVENGYAERVEAQTVALEVANVDELESAEPEAPATPEEPKVESPKRKRN